MSRKFGTMVGITSLLLVATAACPDARAARDESSGGTRLAIGATVRVSVGDGGQQAEQGSGASKVSDDGSRVVFGSAANNLVDGDTNDRVDVFLRDVGGHTTALVSRGRGGRPANGDSRANGISSRGRYVAYDSSASNLVAQDTNDAYDVFVRDMSTTEQKLISTSVDRGPTDGASFRPAISGSGRFVAFDSYATNVVADDTNGGFDVFLHDRRSGTNTRVSIGPGGSQANGESTGAAISTNGRFVVFESGASNLVEGDDNGQVDVFRYDRRTRTTELASVGDGGEHGDAFSGIADVSGTGRYVVFTSVSTNLVPDDTNGFADVFIRDLTDATTRRVSLGVGGIQGDDGSISGTVSDDGRIVTFDSWADNLVAGDTNGQPDVFAHDLLSGSTIRASVSSRGVAGNAGSIASSISADGRIVTFSTAATNLVRHDTNDATDVEIHRMN